MDLGAVQRRGCLDVDASLALRPSKDSSDGVVITSLSDRPHLSVLIKAQRGLKEFKVRLHEDLNEQRAAMNLFSD